MQIQIANSVIASGAKQSRNGSAETGWIASSLALIAMTNKTAGVIPGRACANPNLAFHFEVPDRAASWLVRNDVKTINRRIA